MNQKFGGGRQPTGTPSMALSSVVVVVSLLAGASVVHNIYKPNLVTLSLHSISYDLLDWFNLCHIVNIVIIKCFNRPMTCLIKCPNHSVVIWALLSCYPWECRVFVLSAIMLVGSSWYVFFDDYCVQTLPPVESVPETKLKQSEKEWHVW